MLLCAVWQAARVAVQSAVCCCSFLAHGEPITPHQSLTAASPALLLLCCNKMELDHYLGEPIAGMPGSKVGPVPIVQMFGVTKSGNSVM